jgi:uncharacterized protein YpmB
MQRFIVIALIIGFGMWMYNDNEKKDQEAKEKNEQLMKNPDVVDLGIVDGCEVKYYTKTAPSKNQSNAYQSHTFYIAKCDGKSTTTMTQKIGGRTKADEAIIVQNK